MQIVNHVTNFDIFISDPLIVQDMMVNKNALIDKREKFGAAMKNFSGDGFIVSTSNEKWKAKRKGIAHAFFKDKLIIMLEKLKEYTLEAQ